MMTPINLKIREKNNKYRTTGCENIQTIRKLKNNFISGEDIIPKRRDGS